MKSDSGKPLTTSISSHLKGQPKLFLFALVVVFLVIALGVASLAIPYLSTPHALDQGKMISERHEVSGVTNLVFNDFGVVTIVQGDNEGLTVEAGTKILPKIKTFVEKDTLYIGQKDPRSAKHPPAAPKYIKPDIAFILTVKELHSISILHSGTLISSSLKTNSLTLKVEGKSVVDLTIGVQDLAIEMRGNSTVILKGTAGAQNISLEGLGMYNAKDFVTKKSSVDIQGAGTVTVNTADELSMNIKGPGTITYSGKPKILKEDTSGGGKIIKL